MLETMRRGQRWIMWIVIIGVGFVFAVFVGSGAPPGGSGQRVVVDVDGRRFSPRDVDRIRRRQEQDYRRALGDGFDADAAREHLDQLAASVLANQAILASEAERLGLVVSDAEIRDYVRQSIDWATDESGRLRADALRDYTESEFGTEDHFAELVRMDLLARKLQTLLRESVRVSEAEARESLLSRQQEVSVAYVALDRRTPSGAVEIPEDDVAKLLAGNDPRLRARYDERAQQYRRTEAVRVRHILLRVPEETSAEQVEAVRARAEQVLARVRAGASFADVAQETSEDPGTREQGGDLGFVERGGALAQTLEQVAFALAPGQVSDVVRSDAGFHVLRVEEKREARTVPLEEASRELALEILREEAAAAQARQTAERLASAVRDGQSLVDAARDAGLTIERPDPWRRRADGYVPGLGVAPELLTAAFALSEEQPSSARIFEAGDHLVLVQLLERRGPSEEELAAELAAERERLRDAQLARLSQAWLAERRDALAESGKLVYDLSQLDR